MKFIKRFLLLFLLVIILIYVTAITVIPNNIMLLENENLDFKLIYGMNTKKVDKELVQASFIETDISRDVIEISLFNFIPVKEVTINTIPETWIVPLGNTIGLKLYINGVLVIRYVRNKWA